MRGPGLVGEVEEVEQIRLNGIARRQMSGAAEEAPLHEFDNGLWSIGTCETGEWDESWTILLDRISSEWLGGFHNSKSGSSTPVISLAPTICVMTDNSASLPSKRQPCRKEGGYSKVIRNAEKQKLSR
jgi:hypothetical protein